MKIDGTQFGGVSQQSPVQKPGLQETTQSESTRRAARLGYRDTGDKTTEAGLDAAPDQVELSGLSRTLSKLANSDEDRQARIDQLAAQYADGKLEVDAGKVATKIVDDAFHSD